MGRLNEASTWRGIKYSLVAFWIASVDYFNINLKLAAFISAGAIAIAGIILIIVSEPEKTKTKLDDIIFAIFSGLLGHDSTTNK